MIQPKHETEDLLLSITKDCETLIEQTHKKPEETLEFKLTKSRETFHLKPPIPIQGDWMLVLTSLEVYNSIFNITEENCYFELYTDPSHQISFVYLKHKVAEVLDFSHNSNKDLQNELL